MVSSINLNLSEAFINKDLQPGYDKRAFGNSFHPKTVTPQQLVEHITSGKAFTLGYYRGSTRRKDTFISSQLMGLDFDKDVSIAQCMNDDFIGKNAFFIYATPSSTPEHPKTRVLFLLGQPIYNAIQWERLQRALIWQYEFLDPDPSCKDAARLFFGSTKTNETWSSAT